MLWVQVSDITLVVQTNPLITESETLIVMPV